MTYTRARAHILKIYNYNIQSKYILHIYHLYHIAGNIGGGSIWQLGDFQKIGQISCQCFDHYYTLYTVHWHLWMLQWICPISGAYKYLLREGLVVNCYTLSEEDETGEQACKVICCERI